MGIEQTIKKTEAIIHGFKEIQRTIRDYPEPMNAVMAGVQAERIIEQVKAIENDH